ncbi:hypothetical protein M8J77_011910 [Diaphorina citri]|nr:hypothetical protein M8J77_011910 [Diaphorina citri]
MHPGQQNQGTPSATAGSNRIRTGGDRVLRRRTPVGQLNQAQNNNNNENAEIITSSQSPSSRATATRDVSQGRNISLPETTRVVRPRVRMKWTTELNTFIMRTYYHVTKLETDMTAYVRKMHEAFRAEYPDIEVSEQRIADQRRVIIRNKLLSEITINNIKMREQNQQEMEQNIGVERTSDNEIEENDTDLAHLHDTQNRTMPFEDPRDGLTELIENTLRETLQKYSGIDPTKRPWIPVQKTSRKFSNIVQIMDEQVAPFILDVQTFEDLHDAIYCMAYTAAKCNGAKIKEVDGIRTLKSQGEVPPWKKRLINKVEIKRKEIAQLTEYKKGNPGRKLERKAQQILEKYRTHTTRDRTNNTVGEVIDTLKQKLTVFSTRLRRYSKCNDRKKQNKEFQNNEKKFYRQLKAGNTNMNNENTNTPSLDQVTSYWSGIWTNNIEHNNRASWLRTEENEAESITAMEEPLITETILQQVLEKTHNWKSPGSDNIHNYWYKKLTCLHRKILEYINDFIEQPLSIPRFLTEGKTYLLPKGKTSPDPSKYRPITCLQTFYKILTACIAHILSSHIESQNIMTEEQKGCRKGAKGCKEQLIIDSVILNHARKKNRKMSCCFIDYQKAYDSVPHTWLIKVLKLYKIHPKIVNLLETLMQNWRTILRNNQEISNTTRSDETCEELSEIKIRRGIFQGDSLSPLWFCLALNPLSKLLRRTGMGYKLNTNEGSQIVSHQLYMDDLKLYAPSYETLNQLITCVDQFSVDIKMKFGLDKCRVINLNKGKYDIRGVQLEDEGIIEAMNETEYYKYLGYEQARNLNHTRIKESLTHEFMARVRAACKTDLNSKHLYKTLNTLAIPILTYSFGIIKWTDTDLANLMRKVRVELTKQRKHHPKASTIRLTLPRREGGRGLIDINNLHNGQVKIMRKYFHERKLTSPLHANICAADQNYTPLNLASTDVQRNESIISNQEKNMEWRSKPLHGRHPHDTDHTFVDKIASHAWLVNGELFPETEGFMVAIQDQVVNTKNYMKHIIKDPNVRDDRCRRCKEKAETIQHITSGCSAMSQTEYLHRHNQVAAIIHQNISSNLKLIDEKTPYYKYEPPPVIETAKYTVYYDRTIMTDKTIPNNRPDIVVHDKERRMALLVDIAIPNTHNMESTVVEKNRKYQELRDEVRRMWRLEKVEIVPIILSATGIIPKNLHQSLQDLGIQKNVFMLLQKAVILNTTRIVRKFLS